MAVIENARFTQEIKAERASAGAYFASWSNTQYVDLLATVTKRGARLGLVWFGLVTGQRLLHSMGKDSYILSSDVVTRLVAENVVDKAPTSKRDLTATQSAFDIWYEQSGRGLTCAPPNWDHGCLTRRKTFSQC